MKLHRLTIVTEEALLTPTVRSAVLAPCAEGDHRRQKRSCLKVGGLGNRAVCLLSQVRCCSCVRRKLVQDEAQSRLRDSNLPG